MRFRFKLARYGAGFPTGGGAALFGVLFGVLGYVVGNRHRCSQNLNSPFCGELQTDDRRRTHHTDALCYSSIMATRKTASARSVRQSVTIPATLLPEVRRAAKEQHITMSRALVALAERGVRAEAEAKEQLKSTFNRFLAEDDPGRKNEAGIDLIRAIFGTEAIA